ncbi:DNA-binding MarR family transcriptional regulator [Fontibacillus solani]|uniref:DNA-binding MarR family transcriptional regulator n=1 Tax=Fontibacillus solani TaxID=1572857 RepID=A0A7W3STK5_9BACL|nr:MarR family transcriptional regulator [Fontibacillus solani]MBA9085869.1 DNA-binding MarR family transcriptional regulator [Fontibacillus solani]
MVRRFVKERDKVDVEGVSLPALMVLNKLIRDGSQRLGDLGEELDFTSGAVTGLCDKLESKGLAKRVRMEHDRRAIWLDITEQGRCLMDRHRNVGTRSITTLFEGMTSEQLKEFIQFSTQIVNNLDQYAATLNRLAQDNEHNACVTDVRNAKTSRFLSY